MTVALSELNRAALGGREQYGFVHWAAGCYVLAIGGYSVATYCSEGEGFRAVMCAGAQVLAIVCSVLARRAMTGQMPLSFLLAAIGALGCAWWSAQGLKHAWESNGSETNMAMVVFLAALEPGLFVLAEHIKEGREALRRAQKAQDDEEAATLKRIRDKQDREDRERAEQRNGKPVLATQDGVAIAAGVLLTAGAGIAGASAPPALLSEQSAIVSTNPGYPSAREHAVALKQQNPKLTEQQAASITGAGRSTVGTWWRQAGLAGRAVAA